MVCAYSFCWFFFLKSFCPYTSFACYVSTKKTREKSFPSNKIFSYDQNGKHMEKMICMTEMFSPNNDVRHCYKYRRKVIVVAQREHFLSYWHWNEIILKVPFERKAKCALKHSATMLNALSSNFNTDIMFLWKLHSFHFSHLLQCRWRSQCRLFYNCNSWTVFKRCNVLCNLIVCHCHFFFKKSIHCYYFNRMVLQSYNRKCFIGMYCTHSMGKCDIFCACIQTITIKVYPPDFCKMLYIDDINIALYEVRKENNHFKCVDGIRPIQEIYIRFLFILHWNAINCKPSERDSQIKAGQEEKHE